MRAKYLCKINSVLMVIGFIILFLSSISLAGEFDTNVLRHDAEFKKEVFEDIFWVPLNVLGEPKMTKDQLLELKGKPEELQEKITTLYDAIHYLQVSEIASSYEFNRTSQFWAKGADGGVEWLHVAPAQYSLKENRANPAAMNNIINFFLKDNYEEVGYFWASPRIMAPSSRPFFLNYIKHEGRYYIINPEPYVLFGKVGLESGLLSDYHIEENFAPLHEAGDLEKFLEYYLETQRGIYSVAAFTGETAPPFTYFSAGLDQFIGIPETFPREQFQSIYQERKEYQFVSPPWECPQGYKRFPEYTYLIPAARTPGEVRIKSGCFYTTIADRDEGGFGIFISGSYQLINQVSIKGRVIQKFGDPGLTGFIGLFSYNPPETGLFKVSIDAGPGYFLGNMGDEFAELGWEFGVDTGVNVSRGVDMGIHAKYRLLRFEKDEQQVDFSGWDLGGSIIFRF